MKKIIAMAFLLYSCSTNGKCIEVENAVFIESLRHFIYELPYSFLYKDQKVVTVGIWENDEGNGFNISFRNYIPNNCKNIIGIGYQDGFTIYYLAENNYPSFFKVIGDCNCRLEEAVDNKDIPPLPIRYEERYFFYEDGVLNHAK